MSNILIVGGGASGVAAALSARALAPDAKITLCEKRARLGGMADSRVNARGEEYNYGVQGVHESFEYTLRLVQLAQQQDPTIPDPKEASLSAQFVVPEGTWNTRGTGNIQFDPKDVKRFKQFCEEVAWGPDVYSFVDIVEAGEDNGIDRRFIDTAVLPTLALFFGTGAQQAGVPASVAAQVFGYGETAVQIFDIHDRSFITTRNNMKALPPLGRVYRALHRLLEANRITVQLSCETLPVFTAFQCVILATQAEDAIALLPPGHPAIKVLSNVKYYDDVSVTHDDEEHMKKTFGASQEFNYYMRDTVMGFALNQYQQLRYPLYQSIFLNTKVPPVQLKNAVLDPWRQMSCSVQHLTRCAAKLSSVQGPHIYFAGSYTLVNSHEIAIMSGIKAAQLALGTAKFPTWFGAPNAAYEVFRKL